MFPIQNRPDPPSLWGIFYPKRTMNWDWSASGSQAVPHLWHLRERLSRSGKVVYTKWYQGRATFFSKDLFTALLSFYLSDSDLKSTLSPHAAEILSVLEDSSPAGRRALKKRLIEEYGRELSGAEIDRAVRELSSRLLITGYGEVDEGGYPSLSIGATELLFEDLWDRSLAMNGSARDEIIAAHLTARSPFRKALERTQKASRRIKAP